MFVHKGDRQEVGSCLRFIAKLHRIFLIKKIVFPPGNYTNGGIFSQFLSDPQSFS